MEIIKIGKYNHENLSEVAFHTVKTGDISAVLALLEQGADPNTPDHYGFTALSRAAQFDNLEMVNALLAAGADPNRASQWGKTALMSANTAEMARALIMAGADVDAQTIPNTRGFEVGETALMDAACHGQSEVIQVLLEHGADTAIQDALGRTALMVASIMGHDDIAKMLDEDGAGGGLVGAAMLGDVARVQGYLQQESAVPTSTMAVALWWAAGKGRTEIVGLLLDSGSDVEARQERGLTALMNAAWRGHADTVRLLIERGADVNARSDKGGTALAVCLESGKNEYEEVVRMLLDAGADVNLTTMSGWTALMAASIHGYTNAVRMLLERGADPNLFTDEKASADEGCSTTNALMLAVGNGRVEIVRLLLQYGADPLAQNSVGSNVLDVVHRRANRGHKEEERQEILEILEASRPWGANAN
jgi:ankyrin repeat protein